MLVKLVLAILISDQVVLKARNITKDKDVHLMKRESIHEKGININIPYHHIKCKWSTHLNQKLDLKKARPNCIPPTGNLFKDKSSSREKDGNTTLELL